MERERGNDREIDSYVEMKVLDGQEPIACIPREKQTDKSPPPSFSFPLNLHVAYLDLRSAEGLWL